MTRAYGAVVSNFEVHFYAEPSGRKPAREWISSLPATEQRAAVAALTMLARDGIGVCADHRGKHLGGGLFELRVAKNAAEIRRSLGQPAQSEPAGGRIMLRLFCHAHGNKMVVVLGGYDKSRDPNARRQQREIRTARDRLRSLGTTDRAPARQR